jgi:hypothetical protein
MSLTTATPAHSNDVVDKGRGGGGVMGNRTGARAELQVRLDD